MLTEMRFKRNSCDESLYTPTEPTGTQIPLVAFVNDMLLAGDDQIRRISDCIDKKVELRVDDSLTTILGMNVDLDSDTGHLTISNQTFIYIYLLR